MESDELFTRYKKNPILTKKDLPAHIRVSTSTIFNPGVGDRDKETLLAVRRENMTGYSDIFSLTSKDGVTDWKMDGSSIFIGDGKTENYGPEDPRLTWIGLLKKWAIVHTLNTVHGPLVGISTTTNFRTFKHLGNVLPVENKDAALFPKPINGYWYLLNRPVTAGGKKEIWICSTKCTGSDDDFRSWGDHKVLISTDGTPAWDGCHVGINTPPLETKDGWLALYHGVKQKIYRLGLAMFSLEDPTKITHRTKEWVMGPSEAHDFMGTVAGAIFPCRLESE